MDTVGGNCGNTHPGDLLTHPKIDLAYRTGWDWHTQVDPSTLFFRQYWVRVRYATSPLHTYPAGSNRPVAACDSDIGTW